MSHACPFDQACDRHPTPPLSPSMSSGSSRESSAPSFSTSPSPHLHGDIGGLHSTYPDSQPSGHSNPVIEFGRMPDGLEDDAVMLDEWEGEGKREERDHGPSLDSQPGPVSFPLQLDPSSFSQTLSCSRRPSQSQQPSTDAIDVTKLARQDQPPPAYENVDERPSSLSPRASRPLPRPPIDRLTSSSSTRSVELMTDAGSAWPHETTDPTSQASSLAPICTDPMVSTSHPFPTLAGTSQPPAVSVGMLRPLDPPSQDQLDRPAGISPLASQSPFSAFPPRTPSEPSQQSVPPSSFNHDPLWTMNQTVSAVQQETSRLMTPVSSRPISSPGFIETPLPPPPYVPSEVSQSRSGRHVSDSAVDVRSTPRPRAALPASSNRGLPPPAPPTILDPPPAQSNSVRRSRPHEPFLSDATPPDSWIAVETSPIEYRLVVRLPGFRRDAITLAARRRRVLHVVADSWEPGGGHFERRISFGYDADLGHVRAEFDGEILRVIVPRRTPPLTWYGAACE